MTQNSPSFFKSFLPHVLAVIFFVLLTLLYFKPLLEGRTLQPADITQWKGMAQELLEFNKANPDVETVWSGSMFSGMPSYQFAVVGTPPNHLYSVQQSVSFSNPETMGPVFVGLVCAYIFFFLLTGNIWIAILGAIACSFSSYNFVILQAGHVTKAWAIAYMPLVLSGFLLIVRNKYLLGGALFALSLALELMSAHVQISYYLAIFCFALFVGYTTLCVMKKETQKLLKASLTFFIALCIALLPSIASLYADLEMSKESMRGPSELKGKENVTPSTGLDIDYAFSWSYGVGETLSLMIPDIRGGASGGTVGKGSHLYKELQKQGQRPGKEVQTYTYWGEQPGTSGPVYFGATICFLFVLGMFVIKSKGKWLLLGVAFFFIFLSWGKNMLWFNEFMFQHLPMYSKFRAPSMSLVIPALIFPIIAGWGLMRIFKQESEPKEIKKYIFYSLGMTGGICLILSLIPGLFFNFQSLNDIQFTSQLPEWYYDALLADRASLLKADALRSLIFILLTAACVFLFTGNDKKRFSYALIGICVLILVDLWMVDKRYVNDSHFVKKGKTEQVFDPTMADNIILEDKSPSYRVLNLSTNTFNETATSYFHKSIGGYHAAKLRRYQELIDSRIRVEIQLIAQGFQTATSLEDINQVFQTTPTLNMLNAKYIVYSAEQPPLLNPERAGNAWFIQNIQWVNDANQELEALNTIDPRTMAVVDKRFADVVSKNTLVPDSMASIELLEYRPNYLKYESNTSSGQIAVFSEIYYKNGWKVFIDGEPADHFRANWVLRAMNVPAGKHSIEFKFEPDTYFLLASVGSITSLVLIFGFLGVLGFTIVTRFRKKEETAS